MSKAVYVGVANTARKVKKMYVGVDGVARKVKKGYIGVDGKARLFYLSHPFVSYSGEYTMEIITHNDIEYELYKLTTDGTLVLAGNVDCWLCGGGGGGASANSTAYTSGGGGGGGYVNSGVVEEGSHTVVIGEGGASNKNGGTTSVGSLSASGGDAGSGMNGGNGGSGGGAGGSILGGAIVNSPDRWGTVGTGAGTETYPFGITSLLAHCGGGAGGKADLILPDTEDKYPNSDYYGETTGQGNGGSNGSNGYSLFDNNGNTTNTHLGLGGEYGGGNAGSEATFYGGGGGGGRRLFADPSVNYEEPNQSNPGSSGYQGVVYLLIKVD